MIHPRKDSSDGLLALAVALLRPLHGKNVRRQASRTHGSKRDTRPNLTRHGTSRPSFAPRHPVRQHGAGTESPLDTLRRDVGGQGGRCMTRHQLGLDEHLLGAERTHEPPHSLAAPPPMG
jgi:hypothetical protein